MREHAQAVRGRVRELGQKAYWSQFEKTPEFVVMFVPVEASVAAVIPFASLFWNRSPASIPDLFRYRFLHHIQYRLRIFVCDNQ